MYKNIFMAMVFFATLIASGGLMSADTKSATKQTVLVTGANRGIGLEFARQLKQRGYHVIATARSPERATELKALAVQVEQLDVTDANSVSALAEKLKGNQIDMLINNAGVKGDAKATLQTLDFDQIANTYDVNTFGPMRVTQALYPNLKLGSGKKIIHISSIMGSIENNGGGYYDYRSSKTALNQLNKSLALELADEGFISVVLHPGWVKTDLGGANASLTTTTSVNGLMKVIEQLSADDNAGFIDYQGNQLPW